MAQSERLQITVPEDVAEEWKKEAYAAGVSLSSWLTMQVNRPDSSETMVSILGKLESMEKNSTAAHAVLAQHLPNLAAGISTVAEKSEALHEFVVTSGPDVIRWTSDMTQSVANISKWVRQIGEWVNGFDDKFTALRRRLRRE